MDYSALQNLASTAGSWSALPGLAASAGACVAAFGIWKAAQTQRFNLSIQVYYQLERDFEKLAHHRSSAAEILLDDHARRVADPNVPIDPALVLRTDVGKVLGFLDTVGMLLRRKAIDPQLAFHGFGSISVAYWRLAIPLVKVARIEYERPWMWNDLEEYLHKGVLKYLRNKGRKVPSDEFVKMTLERERQAYASNCRRSKN
jgi:hypothetical protein